MKSFDKDKQYFITLIKENNRARLFLDKKEAVIFIKNSLNYAQDLRSWIRSNKDAMSHNQEFFDGACSMIAKSITTHTDSSPYEECKNNLLSSDLDEKTKHSILEFDQMLSRVRNDILSKTNIPPILNNRALEIKYSGMIMLIAGHFYDSIRNEVEDTIEKRESSSWKRHLDIPPYKGTINFRDRTSQNDDMGRK